MKVCYNNKKPKKKCKVLNCAVDWDVKSIRKDAAGKIIIEGFANTVNKDRVGDVVYPSAFSKTLEEYMDNPILLYMHDWDAPIGKVIEAKIVDDENAPVRGLWVKAEISGASDVESVRIKIAEGSLKTFSIGYNEIDSDYDKNTQTNYVTELELLEISVVTIPANPNAKFTPTADSEKSNTSLSEGLLNYLAEALNQLSSDESIDGKFLQDVISLYEPEK